MTEIDYLLKLRLAVGRVGEMDLARWWNTSGQLGPLGSSVLRRGFPRTHRFAAARSVFAVASARCLDIYDPPDSVTLWKLPAEVEDEFEQHWETCIDSADSWEPFFEQLETCTPNLEQELVRLELVTDAQVGQLAKLRRSAEQRAVAIPGSFAGSIDDLALLALAFARGEAASPTVPFQSWTERL